jgi:membrane-associated phospholipid phosphatase
MKQTAFEKLFRIMIKPGVMIAYIFLMYIMYQYVDRPVAQAVYDQAFSPVFILRVLTYLGKGILYLVLLPIIGIAFKLFHRHLAAVRAGFLWICVAFSNLICFILKISLGRARPSLWFDDGLYGFYGYHFDPAYWSFPSGHVTTVMGLLFGLFILFPRYCKLYIFIGLLMMVSRVLLLQHYVSDVLVAAGLALLEVGFVWFILRRYPVFQKIFNQ